MTEDVQVRQNILVPILIRRIRTLHVTHHFLPTLQPTRTNRHGKLLSWSLPPFETVQTLSDPGFYLLLHPFPVDYPTKKTQCLFRATVCAKQTCMGLHEAEPVPSLIRTRLTLRYHRHPKVFSSLHGHQTLQKAIIRNAMIIPGTLDASSQTWVAPLILMPRNPKATGND